MPDMPILRSLEQARALKSDLVDQLQRLQADLSNRNLMTPGGQRVNGHSYFNWRQQKIEEMNELARQIRYAKDWIMTHSNMPKSPDAPQAFDVDARIEALESLYRRVRAYADMQKESGVSIDRLEEQWQGVVFAIQHVDKHTQMRDANP